jgi:hypothetical protein
MSLWVSTQAPLQQVSPSPHPGLQVVPPVLELAVVDELEELDVLPMQHARQAGE